MRLLIAALAGFALAVVPALAAEHSVTARNLVFAPSTITVTAGDRVTWSQTDVSHTLHFEGEAAGTPLTSPITRQFDTPGTYRYFCDPHAPDMAGRVVVQAPETTATSTAPAETTPAPSATTTTQTTTTQTSVPVVKPSVRVRVLSASRAGVRLRITSDRARRLTGTLRRGGRRAGTVRLAVRRGTRTYRVRRGRRLARGSYTLALRSAGAYGLPLTVRFRVG